MDRRRGVGLSAIAYEFDQHGLTIVVRVAAGVNLT